MSDSGITQLMDEVKSSSANVMNIIIDIAR